MVGWRSEGDTRVCLLALTSELRGQLKLLTHPSACGYSSVQLHFSHLTKSAWTETGHLEPKW